MTTRARARQEKRKVSARKMAEEHKSGFSSKCYKINDDTKLFIVKKEEVKRIDIIPYVVPEGAKNPYAEPGDLHMERTYYSHRDIGPDGDMYPCMKKTFGKPCPICDHRQHMLKDPDSDAEAIKQMAPKERQLWNVFDHDDPDRGAQLWDFSFHLFGKLMNSRVNNADEEDGYEFYADPDEGMTLKVGFEEKSFGGNTFYEATTIDFKPRRQPLEDELLDKALVLDSLLIEYEYDELKEIFLQTKHEDKPVREPKDEDEEPKVSRRSRPVKEEVEDDDDDFEKEQVPKEERPKRRSRPSDTKEEADASNVERPSARKTSETSTTDASPSRRRKSTRKDPTEGMPKASDFGIKVNMLADHAEHGSDCSVIAISKDETAVYILDAKNEKHSVTPDSLSNLGFPEEDEAEEKPKTKAAKAKEKKEPEPDNDDDAEWDEEWEDE